MYSKKSTRRVEGWVFGNIYQINFNSAHYNSINIITKNPEFLDYRIVIISLLITELRLMPKTEIKVKKPVLHSSSVRFYKKEGTVNYSVFVVVVESRATLPN